MRKESLLLKFYNWKQNGHYAVIEADDSQQYWMSRWTDRDHPDYDDVRLAIYNPGWRKRKLQHQVGQLVIVKNLPREGIWFLQEVEINPPYREQHLATALMDCALEAARKANPKYVIGFAHPMSGADPNFDLFKWYGRWGFVPGELRSVGAFRHNIVLKLH